MNLNKQYIHIIMAIIFSFVSIIALPQKNLSVSVKQHKHKNKALKCLLLCIGNDKLTQKIATTIKFDLEFTDQLALAIKKHSRELTDKQLKKLHQKGVSLYLSASYDESANALDIALKNTHSAHSIFTKSFTLNNNSHVHAGHLISKELIPKLTGSDAISCSSLVYCKQFSSIHKALFIADYTCRSEKALVKDKTLNVAPRWHSYLPQIFFSQFTNYNGKLVALNLKTNKRKTICSYDGLNMQPSFSPTGDKVVLCLSAKKGNSELYLYDAQLCKKQGRRVFVPITQNGGNNSSPCMLANGDIIFCSDYEVGYPQLYYFNANYKTTHRLTSGRNYCAGPSYCEKTNSVVYIRPVNRIFQLWTINLDEEEPKEQQLTFGKGDKLDPTWSPCGNYVAFTYDYLNKYGKKIPQIATFNPRSKKIRVLTKDAYPKSFPNWTSTAHYQL